MSNSVEEVSEGEEKEKRRGESQQHKASVSHSQYVVKAGCTLSVNSTE